MEPWGYGNPTPVFAARGVRLMEPARVLKEKHLKWRVAQGTKSFDALGWGWAERQALWAVNGLMDIAFTIDENVYQRNRTLQLIVKDIQRPTST